MFNCYSNQLTASSRFHDSCVLASLSGKMTFRNCYYALYYTNIALESCWKLQKFFTLIFAAAENNRKTP